MYCYHQLAERDCCYCPTEKKKEKEVGEVLYHREMENKLTAATNSGSKFNISERKKCTGREDGSKSYKSNAF